MAAWRQNSAAFQIARRFTFHLRHDYNPGGTMLKEAHAQEASASEFPTASI
jgi:hypothetical protein